MKNLWLDIGNTRLKYWITEHQQIVEHAADITSSISSRFTAGPDPAF